MVENIQETQKAQDKSVTVKLEGEDAARFEAYMKQERINLMSVAARKLMLERLDQVLRLRSAEEGAA